MKEECRYDIIPKKYFNEFIKIKFYNRTFNIPKSYKEYLEYIYGKNWLIPDPDYQWRTGNTKKVLNASIIDKPNNYKSVIKFYQP